MIKLKLKSKHYILLGILFLVIVSFFLSKNIILYRIGRFLLVDMEPKKSDMIVILRGDESYSRTLEAADLYKKGLADMIFLSTSLKDNYPQKLKKYNIEVPTKRKQLVSILRERGIPEEAILLDNQTPGGGTQEELKRIRKMVKQNGYSKIIIVTSWYHTRRTYLICKRTFRNDNLRFFIVAAKNDISSPSNWWRYRYEALNVMEEFPKLIIFYLSPILKFSFADDPK